MVTKYHLKNNEKLIYKNNEKTNFDFLGQEEVSQQFADRPARYQKKMMKKKVMKPLTPMIILRLLLIVPWTKAIFPLPIPQQKFHPNIQIGAQITKIRMRTNPLQEVLPGLKGNVSYK